MTGAYMPKAKSQEWETPPKLFTDLWKEFGPFDMDPACRVEHATATTVLAHGGAICVPEDEPLAGVDRERVLVDGLMQNWSGRVFLNPPYGSADLMRWTTKATQEIEARRAVKVIALLPTKTDQKWWATSVMRWYQSRQIDGHPLLRMIRFLPGRQRFSGQKNSASFPSVIVGWWK